MSMLRTGCPTCGEPHVLEPAHVILHIADGVGRYVFACELCGTVVSRPVTDRSLQVLIAARVRPIDASAPATTVQPAARLTLDDLLEFHQLLSTPTWFDQLVAQEGAE